MGKPLDGCLRLVTCALMLAGCSLARDVDRLKAGEDRKADAATPAPTDMAEPVDTLGAGGQGGRAGGPDGAPDAAPPPPDASPRFDSAPAEVSPPPPDGPPAGGASAIYWVDSSARTINRADPDGSKVRVLATLSPGTFLRSIAVNSAQGKLYVTDSGAGRIRSANLDGSDLRDLVVGLDEPVGIALDTRAGKIYVVVQGGTDGVFRCNLDGSALEPVIAAGLANPYGVAIDADRGKLYVVDNRADAIFRSGLDGSGLERLPTAGLSTPIEIALDPVEQKIYWSDFEPMPTIRRANLDGSGAEDVVHRARDPGLTTPLGVAVDPVGRKLYFTDGGASGRDALLRADLDGSNITILISNGLSAPRGIALGF